MITPETASTQHRHVRSSRLVQMARHRGVSLHSTNELFRPQSIRSVLNIQAKIEVSGNKFPPGQASRAEFVARQSPTSLKRWRSKIVERNEGHSWRNNSWEEPIVYWLTPTHCTGFLRGRFRSAIQNLHGDVRMRSFGMAGNIKRQAARILCPSSPTPAARR